MSYGNNTQLIDAIRAILGLDPLPMKAENESKRSETERFWTPLHTGNRQIPAKRRYE